MQRTIQLTAIALLSVMFVSLSAYIPALAQAGSTGGTLGKTNKSVSGEREEETRPTNTHRQNPTSPKATGCGKIVGTWAWHYLITTETVFRSDGSGSNSTGQTSSWTCSGRMVIARWDRGAVEHIKISGDGNRLSISIVNCGTAPLCTLGARFPAMRK